MSKCVLQEKNRSEAKKNRTGFFMGGEWAPCLILRQLVVAKDRVVVVYPTSNPGTVSLREDRQEALDKW